MDAHSIPRIAAIAAITLALAALAGCPGASRGNGNGNPPVATVDVTVDEFLSSHNARATQLAACVAYGTVELRWTDDRGSHFQNADIECVIAQPTRTAFRIDKAGTIIFWFGSNNDRYWLFDDTAEDTLLITRPHPSAEDVFADDTSILPVPPLALLDLLGITPLRPFEGNGKAPLTMHPDEKFWTCECQATAGRLRLLIDPKTRMVRELILIDDQGREQVRSRLDRFKPVEVEGSLEVSWPLLPTLVNIEELGGRASIRLGLEDPTTSLADQPTDVLFNLETMMQVLPPDVIDGELSPRDSE